MISNTEPMCEPGLALVTGGAKRLGAAIARALHARGYAVAIHYLNSATAATTLSDELNRVRQNSCFTVAADLSAPDSAPSIAASLAILSAPLRLVVNNASVFEPSASEDEELARWERLHAINTRAPYLLSLALAETLAANSGSIVNITDINAEKPRAGYAAYCASKAGLLAVTRSLALDLAPQVRVNAVAPGAILWADDEDDVVRAETLEGIPLQRCGQPQDIAEAVCFLADAQYVSGHVLNVDGGRMLKL